MRSPGNAIRTVLNGWRRYVVFDSEQNAISIYRLSELDDCRASKPHQSIPLQANSGGKGGLIRKSA